MESILLSVLFVLLYSVYGGVVWRLRGGAIGNLIPIGTTGTRIITMTMLAAPLALITMNYWYLLLMPHLWLGLALAGWGPFMAMGRTIVTDENGWVSEIVLGPGPNGYKESKESWIKAIPRFLGIKEVYGWWWCFWGFAFCGFMVQAGAFTQIAWLKESWYPLLMIPLMSVALPLVYEVAWRIPPKPKSRFPKWLITHFPKRGVENIDYGEVFYGTVLAAALAIAVLWL